MQRWYCLIRGSWRTLWGMSEGTHLTAEVRRRAVRAVHEGMSRKAVAAAYGVERTTLYRWLRNYTVDGEAGLDRRAGSGRPRKLEELSEIELRALILKGPLQFGYETDLWTVGRLRRVITEEFPIVLSKNTVWRRLREAGLTYQKPEREYYEIDEESRKRWLRYEDPSLREKTPRNSVLSGRIQCFTDGVSGKNMGPLWRDAQSTRDGQAGRNCRQLSHQS